MQTKITNRVSEKPDFPINRHRDDIGEEPILFKEAKFRLGVSNATLAWWLRYGHLQSFYAHHRRWIVLRSVRIIAAELHRLPELHCLIDQLRPRYPEDTIAGLLAVVAAAERRLAVVS